MAEMFVILLAIQVILIDCQERYRVSWKKQKHFQKIDMHQPIKCDQM